MKKILLFATLLGLLAACAKSEVIEGGKLPIGISVGQQTKANDSQFDIDDKVGIYVVNYADDESGTLGVSGNHVDNMCFTYGGNAWTPDETIYWKDRGTPADFYAYYPYSTSVSTIAAHPYNVRADQSQEEDFWASDFLWGKSANVTPTASPVPITVKHVFSRILIDVVPGEGYTDETWSAANVSVKVVGVKTSSTVDLSSGVAVADGESGEIIPLMQSASGTAVSYMAMMVPQTVADNSKLIVVTVDGTDYVYRKGFTFKANTQHKFSISVNKNDCSVNVTIGEWEIDEDVKEGDAVEEEIGIPENNYIVYTADEVSVPSGDSYWRMNAFLLSRVSTIDNIEMKFQMSEIPFHGKAYLFYSEMPKKNNGAYLDENGLVLHFNNESEIVNEKILTWEEMGVDPTACIVLRISVTEGTVTVNNKVISVPGISSFTNIGYLFSAYFYENDEGYAKHYYGIPTGSKLYYVKINNAYKGHATREQYKDGTTQYLWKSYYNGVVYQETSRTNFEPFWVSQFSGQLTTFGGGVDEDQTPIDCIRFECEAVKQACVAAFDSNGDGELSYAEAVAVTDMSTMSFVKTSEVSFNEFRCFMSVTSVPDYFFQSSKLTSIQFPRSLKVIGQYAFNECALLSKISLPENIELKYGAFRACTGLRYLNIPGGIKWTTDAFYKCSGLIQVWISEGVTVIPDCAFQECTSLSSISLPNSLKKFMTLVFSDCTSLSSVTIPENVNEMSYGVFRNCTNLTTIYCKPQTPPADSYGSEITPIDNCDNLTKIYVPRGCGNKYKTDQSWRKYSELIVEE